MKLFAQSPMHCAFIPVSYALCPSPYALCLEHLISTIRQHTGNFLLQFIIVDRFLTVLDCPQF
jgi:hypothetical protein